MMTGTKPIKSIPFTNGTLMKNTFQEKIQTALLSVATTGILGCGAFLFKANEKLSKMEQHGIDTDKSIDQIQNKINNIQLDLREVRDKVIRVETLKTH